MSYIITDPFIIGDYDYFGLDPEEWLELIGRILIENKRDNCS